MEKRVYPIKCHREISDFILDRLDTLDYLCCQIFGDGLIQIYCGAAFTFFLDSTGNYAQNLNLLLGFDKLTIYKI